MYIHVLQIAELETEKFELEKKLQEINVKYAQSHTNTDDAGNSRLNDRLTTALANEKAARDQLVKSEAVVAAYESRVRISMWTSGYDV